MTRSAPTPADLPPDGMDAVATILTALGHTVHIEHRDTHRPRVVHPSRVRISREGMSR